MSATGLDVFDKTLQTTHVWLDEISEALGPDRKLAWKVLSVVLHKLRDRMRITGTEPRRIRSCRLSFFYQVRSHAAMHLQIVEIDVRLTRRYVANAPHSWTMRIEPTNPRRGLELNNGRNVKRSAIRAWGQYHSRI
jgi:hypothetical protein